MPRFLVLVALAALLVGARTSGATATARSGLVAYTTGGLEDNWAMRAVRPDGTHDRKLLSPTAFGGGMYRGPSGPKWSSDGTRLLFGAHSRLDHEATRLRYSSVSGKRIREIPLRIKRPLQLYGWDWAPDGRHVVFAAGRPRGVSRIYTAALDGSHLRTLARGESPSWASDDRHIVYQRGYAGSDQRRHGVFVMRTNGHGVRRLTQSEDDIAPSISPDGQQVAYIRRPSPPAPGQEREEWHIIDISGRRDALVLTRDLTNPAYRYDLPQWTPDGSRLATIRMPAVNFPTSAELVTIRPDGSDERAEFAFAQLPSQYVGYEGAFDWQPR
jgi:dipeptidyl aminopeptidase/acylaminoacyl peptidase